MVSLLKGTILCAVYIEYIIIQGDRYHNHELVAQPQVMMYKGQKVKYTIINGIKVVLLHIQIIS